MTQRNSNLAIQKSQLKKKASTKKPACFFEAAQQAKPKPTKTPPPPPSLKPSQAMFHSSVEMQTAGTAGFGGSARLRESHPPGGPEGSGLVVLESVLFLGRLFQGICFSRVGTPFFLLGRLFFKGSQDSPHSGDRCRWGKHRTARVYP